MTSSIVPDPATLKPHPLAEQLPPLADEQRDTLRRSMLAYGFLPQYPIVLHPDDADGGELKVLAGRHRNATADALGLDKHFVLFEELEFPGSPAEFVALEEQRRQMTADQRACVAALQTEDLRRGTKGRGAKSRAAAASFYSVADSEVRKARELLANGRDLFDAVFAGELTLSKGRTRLRARRKVDRLSTAIEQAAPLDESAAELIVGDAHDETAKLKPGSIRLIFADIPYNQGVDYGGAGGKADALDEDAYLHYWHRVIGAAWDALAPDGSLLLMTASRQLARFASYLSAQPIGPRPSKSGTEYPTFTLRRTIAWHETFAEYQTGNYADAWRPLFWATKSEKSFVFNADAIRVPSARQSKYADKRADPAGRVPGSVWEFPRVAGTFGERVPVELGGNANQLPLALMERVVLAHSDLGDVVLDFCNGGGTTGVASLVHGRRYVGIDRNPKAIDATRDRLRLAVADAAGKEGAA